jgi:hypothetical protein
VKALFEEAHLCYHIKLIGKWNLWGGKISHCVSKADQIDNAIELQIKAFVVQGTNWKNEIQSSSKFFLLVKIEIKFLNDVMFY